MSREIKYFRFYTTELLSKWGFGDGDAIGDFLYENGLKSSLNKHELLIKIYRKFVEPNIDQDIVIQTIGTTHNPLRASLVDGVVVDWYDPNFFLKIDPEYIDVSIDDIGTLTQLTLVR